LKCRYTSYSPVTDNNSVQNLSQTRIDGTENSLMPKQQFSWCPDWTTFDGLRIKCKEQLRELQKLVLELQLTTYKNKINATY
jgi:hypothetical protein